MAKIPKIVRIVGSGVPDLYPAVTIYDTTLEHIQDSHPEEHKRIDEVYEAIGSPDRIHKSKTHGKSVILVKVAVASSSGDPLFIPVKIVGPQEAIMTSAYYCGSNSMGELLWKKEDEQ